MIIGTAGHIDHGKTALVRALTGVDTDRLPEEKRRGITIELGFAPLVLDDGATVGIVDVPGHEGFVRTMVAGATGVDLALLVIAVDEGVMPQTREHLTILSLLNVKALIVVLTKTDLVDAEWVALVRDDVASLLGGTVYAGAAMVATSVRDGRGIDELKQRIAAHVGGAGARVDDDLFRMPVDRAFTVKGTGTVVTGTVWSGSISDGALLRLYPREQRVRVRGVQRHGESVTRVGPGERAALALASVDLAEASRGSQLVSDVPWSDTTLIHAEVVRDVAATPWRPREWLRFHLGTSEVGGRVVPVGDPKESVGLARLVLDSPMLIRAGDRFVLRRGQPVATVGGGVVIDPNPPRRRSRPTIGASANAAAHLRQMVVESGKQGVDAEGLPIRLGVSPRAGAQLLQSDPSLEVIAGRVYLKELLASASQAVVDTVVDHHSGHPLSPGLAPAGVASLELPTTTLTALVERLVAEGRIETADGLLRQPGWQPRAQGRDETDLHALEKQLVKAGREPPSVGELRHEIEGKDPLPLLRILERSGLVVQVEPDRFYASSVVAGMMQQMRDGMRGGDVFSPAQLRELLGVSRKFLVPFLEYCDRRGFTERGPLGRVLRSREAT